MDECSPLLSMPVCIYFSVNIAAMSSQQETTYFYHIEFYIYGTHASINTALDIILVCISFDYSHSMQEKVKKEKIK